MNKIFLIIFLAVLSAGILNAQTWTAQASGISTGNLNTVCAVDSNVCWASSISNVVIRTSNGGNNWVSVGSGVSGDALWAFDASTAIASITPSTTTYVYRTTNGGVNWINIFTQPGGYIDAIKFNNEGTGFMIGDPVGGRWSLWKSTNNGVNWDSAGLYLHQTGSEAGLTSGLFLDGNKIWFVTNTSRVYYSTNFGSNWQFGITGGNMNFYVAFAGNIGFTAYQSAFKSTNGGANWSLVTLPMGTTVIYGLNALSGRFWYASQNIYGSTDNGLTFSLQYTSPAGMINTSFIRNGNKITGWAVGLLGGIAKYTENIITGIIPGNGNIPEKFSLSQNYPNPFNPVTKIKFDLPPLSRGVGGVFTTLTVFDILGKEITTLVNAQLQPGSYEVAFDGSNLPSGAYFYKLTTESFTTTKRMLMIK